MEELSELTSITALLRSVEKGNSSESVLGQLRQLPIIDTTSKRKPHKPVPRTKQRKDWKSKQRQRIQNNKLSGETHRSLSTSRRRHRTQRRFLQLPQAPTADKLWVVSKKHQLSDVKKDELNSIEAEENLVNALSLLEDAGGDRKGAAKMLVVDNILGDEQIAHREREKYREQFFSQILSVDTSQSETSTLYSLLKCNGRNSYSEEEEGEVEYIIPPIYRPQKHLEKKVLHSLVPEQYEEVRETMQKRSFAALDQKTIAKVSISNLELNGAEPLPSQMAIVRGSIGLQRFPKNVTPNTDLIDSSVFYIIQKQEKRNADQINRKNNAVDELKVAEDDGWLAKLKSSSNLIDANKSLTFRTELVKKLGKESYSARKFKQIFDKKVFEKIESLKSNMPMDFLFEVGLKDDYNKRTKAKLKNMIKQWGFRLEVQGLLRWNNFVKDHRKQECIKRATDIERVWRGYVGRQEFSQAIEARNIKLEKARFRRLMRDRRQWLSAIQIQRRWRGLLGRRIYAIELEIMTSVLLIQRTWRAKKARMLYIIMKHRRDHQDAAALTIERIYRGYKGRKRAARYHRLKHREIHEKLLGDMEFVILYGFKKEGATRCLQRWFRNTRVKLVKFKGHVFATRIEALFRGHQGRLHAQDARFEKWKRKEKKKLEQVALKLQCHYRSKMAADLTKSMIKAKKAHKEELRLKKEVYLKKKNSNVGVLGNRLGKRLLGTLNPFQKQKEEAAARKIQMAYRARRARRLLKRMKYVNSQWSRHKLDMCAKVIQKYARGWLARRRVVLIKRNIAAIKIQSLVRGQRDRSMLRNKMRYDMAIPNIQRYTRGWLARRKINRVREERERLKAVVTKCQTTVRMYISRRKVEMLRESIHRKAELHKVVVQRIDEAMIYESDRMVERLGFSHKSKLKILERKVGAQGCSSSAEAFRLAEPLRDLFLHFSKPASSMESMKFLAATKEFNGLIEQRGGKKRKKDHLKNKFPGINPVEIDLCFAKAIGNAKRAQQEELEARSKQRAEKKVEVVKGISFQGFCDALSMLGDIRYAIKNDKGTVTGYSIETYRYHTGQRARFFKLLDDYVLAGKTKSICYKYRVKFNKYIEQRALWAANAIQRAARGYWGRNFYAAAKRAYVQNKIDVKRGKKLAKLQKRWRRRQARRELIRRYRDTVRKYLDPVSGLPYWHNPNSNSIRWKKIKWLRRSEDVRTVIELPHPDVEFIKFCAQCNEVTAAWYCIDCDDFYCKSDYDTFHGKGRRREHAKFAVDVCVECEYQVASRECHQCGDFYCDTCFWKMHSKGGLVQHTWAPLLKMCELCPDQKRANAVRCTSNGTDMCNPCYNNSYYYDGYERIEKPLVTRSMQIYRDKIFLERKEAAEAIAAEAREKAEEHRRYVEQVKKIQGLWRMRKSRRLWYPVILNAMEARIAKERRDGEAGVVKGSLRYRLLAGLGSAPVLEVDSHEERVRKLVQLELYEEELWERYPWLTEQDVEEAKFTGVRKTGILKTQDDLMKTAAKLKAAATGENAEAAKAAAKAAADATAKLTGKLAAQALGIEEGQIANVAKQKAKEARHAAKLAILEKRSGLNESIGAGLVSIGNSLKDSGVFSGLGRMVVRRGKKANKLAKRLEKRQGREYKVHKLITERLEERKNIREAEKAWELVEEPEEGDYWYNADTGESTYEDPRTFQSPVEEDEAEVEEEVREQFSESESDDDSGDDSDDSGDIIIKKKKTQVEEVTALENGSWQITHDESGTPYYYNEEGETTYDPPPGFVNSPSNNVAADYYSNNEQGDIHSDWQEAYDDDGSPYYYNSAGETTYEYPW